MNTYYAYEISTGRITHVFRCPADQVARQLVPGETYAEGQPDQRSEYVVDGELTARPLMDLTVPGLVIYGVPAGTRFKIKNSTGAYIYSGVCDDGVLELADPDPEIYTIRLDCFPYQRTTVTIDAS